MQEGSILKTGPNPSALIEHCKKRDVTAIRFASRDHTV